MRTLQTARPVPPIVTVDRPRIYDRVPSSTDALTPEITQDLLEKLLELPVEIFAEIFFFLEPLDLWHLSISGRAFRSVLMSRSSRQIWATARFRLYGPMPSLPEGMSEPQYTRFIFIPECYTCNDKATMIDHFNRIKSCHVCNEKHFFARDEADQLYPEFPVGGIRMPGVIHRQRVARPYHTSGIDPEYRLFLSIKLTGDEASLANYEAGLEERCACIVKSGNAIQVWMRAEKNRQDKEFLDRCEKREQNIVVRMRDLGHDERDIDYDAVDALDLLDLPYDVTEAEWAIMRPALEAATIQNKATRLTTSGPEASDSSV